MVTAEAAAAEVEVEQDASGAAPRSSGDRHPSDSSEDDSVLMPRKDSFLVWSAINQLSDLSKQGGFIPSELVEELVTQIAAWMPPPTFEAGWSPSEVLQPID